jgi:hypothetical protein
MTETLGVGFRSWVEGVECKSRNNARTLVHRLQTFVLFRWQASGSPKQVARDRLGGAFWRQSRANKGDVGTPSVVFPGIISNSL